MTSASNFINVTYLLHGNPNDLRHLLSYPITTVPVSFDGRPTPLKTDKATLTKALESRQHVVFVDTNLPSIKATNLTLRECDATQQIHVRSHDQGYVGERVFPSRRVNASTTYSTNTSLHPSRVLLGNGGLRYSECIHHNRPRPSPATE